MTARTVIQVVPRLAPPAEGVGSYAAALAGALAGLGVATRFVVGDPEWPGGEEAVRVAARTPAALGAALDRARGGEDAAPVLLHYAGYGYQARGCPRWLVAGLTGLRKRRGRLITLFHEVYASGPPWRSSFWTLPWQRRLAAALVRESDALATTLALYGRLLRPWAAGRQIAVQPVFSTVGEPEAAALPPLAARERRLVVFGGAGVRSRAYGEARPALERACAALGVAAIADVGAGDAGAPAAVLSGGGVPVERLGALPAAAVSALLRTSLAGFVAYPPAFLAKSTIFAAYCAHGVLPVGADWRAAAVPGGSADGLAAGRQYWRPDPGAGAPADPQAIADAARRWYAGHSLARQAAAWRELLA